MVKLDSGSFVERAPINRERKKETYVFMPGFILLFFLISGQPPTLTPFPVEKRIRKRPSFLSLYRRFTVSLYNAPIKM